MINFGKYKHQVSVFSFRTCKIVPVRLFVRPYFLALQYARRIEKIEETQKDEYQLTVSYNFHNLRSKYAAKKIALSLSLFTRLYYMLCLNFRAFIHCDVTGRKAGRQSYTKLCSSLRRILLLLATLVQRYTWHVFSNV